MFCSAAPAVHQTSLQLLFLTPFNHRKLLRDPPPSPYWSRESTNHVPGTSKPVEKLPDKEQITEQPGKSCRGRRQQRGGQRPLRCKHTGPVGPSVPLEYLEFINSEHSVVFTHSTQRMNSFSSSRFRWSPTHHSGSQPIVGVDGRESGGNGEWRRKRKSRRATA